MMPTSSQLNAVSVATPLLKVPNEPVKVPPLPPVGAISVEVSFTRTSTDFRLLASRLCTRPATFVGIAPQGRRQIGQLDAADCQP